MLKYLDELKAYHQYWFVTITPYGKEIEPNVPPKEEVMQSFITLSRSVGIDCVGWRYDPIFIDRIYTPERHINDFELMCKTLSGYTKVCVISFIDLYEKVKQNYPEARRVPMKDQLTLTAAFVEIGKKHNMVIKPCGESRSLEALGADCSGCMTVRTFETAIGQNLKVPPNPNNRKECACYLTGDIGAYNTCLHLCKYCYANAEPEVIYSQHSLHDPESPFLIGNYRDGDSIHEVPQESWIDRQVSLFGI
jgi:hypothetical protein